MSIIAAPYAFGCATTSTGTWELTRRADDIVPAAEIRSTCGAKVACAQL